MVPYLSAIFITFILSLILDECLSAERRETEYNFDETTTTADVLMETGVFLRGSLAIVTGATSGLGKETVRSLAIVDCTVIMASRDIEKAEQVKEELIETILKDRSKKTIRKSLERNLIPMYLDLSSLQSVLDFAKEFYSTYTEPLDYLFNNAGVMAVEDYKVTIDGYEQQMAVNHLGHYYLTRLLSNKLIQSTYDNDVPGRVITVSSRAHQKATEPIETAIDYMDKAVSNPNVLRIGYDPWRNYGISKAFNILFARELERREGERGLISMVLHPGVIKSGLQKFLSKKELETKTFDKDIPQGTATQIWLALAPFDKLLPGGYYVDCQIHDDLLRDDLKPIDGYLAEGFDPTQTNEYKLWEISEKLILKKGFTFEFTVNIRQRTKEKDEDLNIRPSPKSKRDL